MRSARWGLITLFALVLAVSATASAQTDQALPPDIVRTTDGAFYRGNILELVPDSHVIILSVTGEHVRVEMDRVAYAGPATDQEQPDAQELETDEQTPPAPVPAQPDVQVRVESDRPGLELHRLARIEAINDFEADSETDETDEDEDDEDAGGALDLHAYVPVCAIPCTTELPAGDLDLAVSQDGGSLVEADDPVQLGSGDVLLNVSYVDRRRPRTVGLVIFCAGLAAGTAMMVGGMLAERDVDDQLPPVVWAGAGVAGASILTGLLLRTRSDDVLIDVSPVSPTEP